MSLDNDLNALGAITAAETREPSGAHDDAVVTEALENTDMENVDSLLVDFSRLEAEAQRVEGLSIAAEKLRTDGKIDQLTAESLAGISRTILGTKSDPISYTQVATKVGLRRALESLVSEEEAARSQAKHACSELITRAGKCAQAKMTNLKKESRTALASLAFAMADFNDEFYSVNLADVVLNDDLGCMGEMLQLDIQLTDPLYNEQSMFHGCKPWLAKLVLSQDVVSVARWINQGKHYVVVDESLVDVAQCLHERSFSNKSVFYPKDQTRPNLGAFVQAAGSVNQTAYESTMQAGITEGIYLLQQHLSESADAVDPQVKLSEVIQIMKVISAMTRAYQASVFLTEASAALYRGLCNRPSATKIETTE